MRIVFGGQMDEHDFHRVGLTHEFLSQLLAQAGFARVERAGEFDLFQDSSANLPSQHVRPTNGRLLWLVDKAAASNLSGGTYFAAIPPPLP